MDVRFTHALCVLLAISPMKPLFASDQRLSMLAVKRYTMSHLDNNVTAELCQGTTTVS